MQAAAAAANPYALQGATGLISLAQNPMAGSTGNPLWDAYAQYAALAAAGVYTTSAATTGGNFSTIDVQASKYQRYLDISAYSHNHTKLT